MSIQEILVVITIFSVGILVAFQIFPSGIRSFKNVKEYDECVQLATIFKERLEKHSHKIISIDSDRITEEIDLRKIPVNSIVETLLPIKEIIDKDKIDNFDKIFAEYSIPPLRILKLISVDPTIDLTYKPIPSNQLFQYINVEKDSKNKTTNLYSGKIVTDTVTIINLNTCQKIDSKEVEVNYNLGTIKWKNNFNEDFKALALFKKPDDFKIHYELKTNKIDTIISYGKNSNGRSKRFKYTYDKEWH